MEQQLKESLGSGESWKRGLFILLFALCYGVAEVVVWAVVVLQFFFLILTGEDNRRLRSLGASLAVYIAEVIRYITLNNDDKPFPFRPWPDEDSLEGTLEQESRPMREERAEGSSSGSAAAATAAAAGVAAAAASTSASAEDADTESRVVEGELMGEEVPMPEDEDVDVINDDRPDAGETESGV